MPSYPLALTSWGRRSICQTQFGRDVSSAAGKTSTALPRERDTLVVCFTRKMDAMVDQGAMQTAVDLLSVKFPPEFTPGARNAVTTCLKIQPSEKVTLITDDRCLSIAASIAGELEKIGCTWNAFVLESIAPRPLVEMPAAVLTDMESSQVSIFAVEVQPNELRSRMQMTDVVNRRRMRHAHMVNITAEIISPEKWGNLPGGECFTAPAEVNGVFVVDGVVGDYLCARYGILRDTPLTINIESNRITRVSSSNKDLERDFWAYTHTDANSDRVGEFAIGTNIGVEHVIGNILQDEKFPGVHIAFGDPYGAHTGAPWKSSTHIDVVGLEFNVWLGNAAGEEQIMRDGRFLLAT